MSKLIAISLCSVGLVLLVAFGSQHQGSRQVTQSAQADYAKNVDRMPNTSTAVNTHLPFMANRGQTDPQVKFYARTFGGTVFLTENGDIVYSLPRAGDDAGRGAGVHFARCSGRENSGLVLTEHLAGGKAGDIHGEGQANIKMNCFTGSDPSRWLRNVPSYASVDLGDVYDGINLRLKAYGNNVEKLFSVAPGADVGKIHVRLSGAERLQVTGTGELAAVTNLGTVTFTRPVAYQEDHGGREFVAVAYTVSGDEYGFTVENYDRHKTLYIDPLLASTFVGGSNLDGLFKTPLIRDGYGNVYVAARTNSADFPVTTGAYDEDFNGGSQDIFVAKLTGDLTTLIAATFLGGSNDEGKWPGVGMAMDENGNLFVTGKTNSTNFPTTPGAYRETHTTTDEDIFVAKLSGDLSMLLAATYLGGSQNEYYINIASDHNGSVYLVGTTGSDDFPVTSGVIDDSFAGGGGGPYPGDVFASKFDDNLTTILASTYLGGSNNEYAEGIAMDESGNLYLTGWTSSPNFPTTPGSYAPSYKGGSYDAFISKLSGDFTVLRASTFIGGNKWDFGYAITLDADKHVYVTGHTASWDPALGFPTTDGAFDREYASGETGVEGVNDDAFVSKLDSNLVSLQSSTFLGGSGWENGNAMTIDGGGNVIVAGTTRDGGFPFTADAHDTLYNGEEDGFISRLDGDLQVLSASTYLGGSANEGIGSIAVDDDDVVYAAGITSSEDFPTTALVYHDWPYDATYNGPASPAWGESRGGDVFITKIDLDWATKDTDGDGYLNQDDNCPYVVNVPNDDADLDGVGDACDNCAGLYNPEQEDINQNWIGDGCEVPESWYVRADGLGEAPTIQAGIDSCINGDTVLVADGVYTGEGNWALDFRGRHLLLRSENGPKSTIIDCQGSVSEPRRAFTFDSDEDSTFIVDGFTIRNGYGPLLYGNSCGGAVLWNNASATMKNCVFVGNAALRGGAAYAMHASPQLINCTFADNSATYGSAIMLYDRSIITPENCLIAFNTGGAGVYCLQSSAATLSCCDVYGHTAGDWVGCLVGQEGVDGNFSADPLFCNVGIGDLGLIDETSPCLPANNDCAELIGALGVGCACNCGVAGDMDCGDDMNPLDVTYLVNYVFLLRDALCGLPNCPYPVGDLDCNNTVNPLDVAYLVSAVYKQQNAICDGCAP